MTNEEKILNVINDTDNIIEQFDSKELDINDTLTFLLKRRYILTHIDDPLSKKAISATDLMMAHILLEEVNVNDPTKYYKADICELNSWRKV